MCGSMCAVLDSENKIQSEPFVCTNLTLFLTPWLSHVTERRACLRMRFWCVFVRACFCAIGCCRI